MTLVFSVLKRKRITCDGHENGVYEQTQEHIHGLERFGVSERNTLHILFYCIFLVRMEVMIVFYRRSL
jgi:hypothetical protein